VAPVVLQLQNLGIATPVTSQITLTGGTTIVDAGSAAVLSPNQIRWDTYLNEGGLITLPLWIRLDGAGGTAGVEVVILTGEAPDLVEYQQISLKIAPTANAQLSDVMLELEPLASDKQADNGYNRAYSHLQRAESALAADDLPRAMRELLGATDVLALIDEAQAVSIRQHLDEVIWDLGRAL
jgi:hypothetical protein